MPAPHFKELPPGTVAVLPLGAVEQHGPHLPLSVDRDLIDGAVQRMLAALSPDQSVLVLPTLSVTMSGEHERTPGTLSLRPETLLAVLRDLGTAVSRAGVQRLVLFNAHGGNTAMLQIAAREMRMNHGLIVASCSWFGFAEWRGHFDPIAYAHDLHGGDTETSAMLALRPDRVRMDYAENFRTAMEEWQKQFRWIGLLGQPAVPAWIIGDLNPHGALGNAAAATVEKGHALLESAGRNFAAFLAEFAKFDHRGH